MEVEFISSECPACRMPMDFVSDLAGTAQGCPQCGVPLVIPTESGSEARRLPMSFETPRVILRRLHEDDWSKLLPYMSDEASLRDSVYEPMDEQEVCSWIAEQEQHRLTDPGQMIHFAIESKEDAAIIGHLGLQFSDAHHVQAWFEPVINRSLFRHELGVEAFSGLLVFGFRQLNLHRMYSHLIGGNAELEKSLAAAGMRREGHFLKDRFLKGEWKDSVIFAMLKEDYERRVG